MPKVAGAGDANFSTIRTRLWSLWTALRRNSGTCFDSTAPEDVETGLLGRSERFSELFPVVVATSFHIDVFNAFRVMPRGFDELETPDSGNGTNCMIGTFVSSPKGKRISAPL